MASASGFLAEKVHDLKCKVEHIENCKATVLRLSRLRHVPACRITEIVYKLSLLCKSILDEMHTVKQQRRFIEQDMEEVLPQYDNPELAYADAMISKVALAPGPGLRLISDSFRKAVEQFYQAAKIEDHDSQPVKMAYCHVLGWVQSHKARVAHLVPRSLDEGPVASLFGTESITIDDPRNCLLLHANIEKALDTGLVAIVPVAAPADDEEVKWKLLVTEPERLEDFALPGIKWNDLHGKLLTFVGRNRPAKRYLCFRYVMTYLLLKAKGWLGWAKEADAGECMWAVPGPFLQRSMLINLSRLVSGHYLPEEFYNCTTFATTPYQKTIPQEDEKYLTLRLANGILTRLGTRDSG
ncbi:hypothetical protein FQN49_008284 [Arthroderma sp. PD_2]|nr:hypothetical protein FQN49_008284 [Arthroderma sp. PD_2]